jgi:hypothetical protein
MNLRMMRWLVRCASLFLTSFNSLGIARRSKMTA